MLIQLTVFASNSLGNPAELDGDILVDTFDGKVKLKVFPETMTGTTIKLKGKGLRVFKKKSFSRFDNHLWY